METPSPTDTGHTAVDVPKRGCLRRSLFWLLVIVASLFLFLTVVGATSGAPVWLHFIGVCLLGWITYLIRVIPQITVNYASVATGLVAFALVVALLHRLLSGLATNETRPTWRWHWSVCIAFMITVMFGVSVAAAGLVHQTTWLMREQEWIHSDYPTRTTRAISNTRQVITALRIWSSDSMGYPDRLTQLFTDGVLNNNRILYYTPAESGTPELLIYLHGSTGSSESDIPLVITPRPTSLGMWVVGTNDSAVSVVKEQQFEELMARWRAREASKKAPGK